MLTLYLAGQGIGSPERLPKSFYMLSSIESAIEDIKQGKLVIVVDDEDRENEGDFITAARMVGPETINFMSKFGRGLICAPLVEERCDELGLELMVNNNTALHETPFTVSVDLLGHGCTTGISGGPGISSRCGLSEGVCFGVRGIPRRRSIWRGWRVTNPLGCWWRS